MGVVIIVMIVAGAKIYTNMQNDIANSKRDNNSLGIKLNRAIAMLVHSSWADTKDKQDQLSRLIEPKW
jgi:hypothetical protein